MIRAFRESDIQDIIRIWNGCAARGEVLYRPLTKAYFSAKFLGDGIAEQTLLVAQEDDGVRGFVAGACPNAFLPGQTEQNTPGYLSVLMVEPGYRGRGLGGGLLAALEKRFAARGKRLCSVSGGNPVNLDWVIPDTPGHEHNNAPGLDEQCMGYDFLLKRGYAVCVREVAMYLNLSEYEKSPVVEQKRASLAAQGITAGLYDVSEQCEFDGMCDRVQSEYWRSVLRAETTAKAPRPILAARTDGHIVGFTGPVDKQENGRGWFTGICTDPLFEQRGIATVLFNDLMTQFIRIGAAYSTLFTGTENHAQRLYLRTGFRPARYFAIVSKALEETA